MLQFIITANAENLAVFSLSSWQLISNIGKKIAEVSIAEVTGEEAVISSNIQCWYNISMFAVA